MLFSCNGKPTIDHVSKDHTAKLNRFVEKLETITDWSAVYFGGYCWIATTINESEVSVFESGHISIDREDVDVSDISFSLNKRIIKIYNKYNNKCVKTDPLDKVLK